MSLIPLLVATSSILCHLDGEGGAAEVIQDQTGKYPTRSTSPWSKQEKEIKGPKPWTPQRRNGS